MPKDVLECTDQWVSEGDLPEVIICPFGFVVTCLQRSLASFGLSCPKDLSIVCYSNYNDSGIFHPVPTRIAGFPDEIGRRAYRRLLELVRDPRERNHPEVIMIPMQFIEGDSIKPPKR